MLRKAPPLEAIEVFVAAARAGSFRAVARDLALSPSAVSRRIAALEAFLGAPLFDRGPGAPRLNAAGRRYLAAVEPAVAAILNATAQLGAPEEARLRVATSHSFAAAWLISRLPDLHRAHRIEVEVIPARDFDLLRSGEAHLGVWGGLEPPEDIAADALLAPEALPVCAARMADGRPAPRHEAELADHALLSVAGPGDAWARWFAAAGRPAPASGLRRREYPTQQLAYEAAAAGLGVALAIPLLADPFLRAGRIGPCGAPRPVGTAYQIFRARRRAAPAAAEKTFIRWLKAEVARSAAEFAARLPSLPDMAATAPPRPIAAPLDRRTDPSRRALTRDLPAA